MLSVIPVPGRTVHLVRYVFSVSFELKEQLKCDLVHKSKTNMQEELEQIV